MDAEMRRTNEQEPSGERRTHASVNTRERWERSDDVKIATFAQLLYELARRFGLWAVVCLGLLYFLVGDVKGTEQKTLEELREHARISYWLQLQECRSLAILAGTRPELCDPPKDMR